jgi:WS/DGAT/MGAT family acyltransferase
MKQLLSAADGAWWRIERPTNPMTITAVFTFAEPLAYERLAALVTGQLLEHARFRQRVVDTGAGQPYWSDVPDLDVADHVIRVELPGGARREALEALVSRLMSERLPRDRPHWQFHLVERYQGGSALVARVHHCIGDGISLVQLLLAMAEPVDAPAGPPVPASVERRRTPRRAGAPAYHEPDGTLPPPRTAAERHAERDAARARAAEDDGVRAVLSPGRLVAAAKLGGGIAAVLARLLDLRADPPTRLRGPLGRAKRAAWSEPIPLDRVRAVGRATGGTINDVLLSAVAGALRGYLAGRGDQLDGRVLRAVVPVNLRRADDSASLGNKFGLVFLPLPVGEADPLDRVAATKRNMDAIKRSPEAVVVFGLLRAFGKTTAALLVTAVKLLARRASAVMTNVPGPRARIRFAGSVVDGVMFWVPCSGRLGLGVSVLSYAGEVRIGVAADERLVPDPTALVTAFHAALDDLVAAAVPAAAPMHAEAAEAAPVGAA